MLATSIGRTLQAEASANVVEVEQGTAVAVAEHAHSIAQRQS